MLVFCADGPLAAQVPTNRAFEITPGRAVFGTMTEDDPVDPEDFPVQVWRFDGARGERVSILMWSDQLDPYLELAVEQIGDRLETLASDDDGGDGFDAFIDFILQEDGTYRILAKALPGGRGEYGLSLDVEAPATPPARARAPSRPVQSRTIRMGESVAGTLDTGDERLFDDSYFERYEISATAGELIVVELRSDDFDSFLAIESSDPREPEVLASDDDSGDGTDSLLAFRFPTTGTYFLRAGALLPDETGDYELIVRRAN